MADTLARDTSRDKVGRLLNATRPMGGHTGNMANEQQHSSWRHGKKAASSVSGQSLAEERSVRDMPFFRPSAKIENTYQLEPSRTFPSSQVQTIVKLLLEKYLEHEEYKPELCRQMSKSLSEVIRARVKAMMIPRYKIICLVHIGQLGDQCIRIGSRCLWDSTCDTFVTYEFKNNSLFAVCTVYAVYAE